MLSSVSKQRYLENATLAWWIESVLQENVLFIRCFLRMGRVIIDSKVDTKALKAFFGPSGQLLALPSPTLVLLAMLLLSTTFVCVVNHLVVVDRLGHFDLNHFDLNFDHHGNLCHYDKEPKDTIRAKGLEIKFN